MSVRRPLKIGDKIRSLDWSLDSQYSQYPKMHYEIVRKHPHHVGYFVGELRGYLGPYEFIFHENYLTDNRWDFFEMEHEKREKTGFGKFLEKHQL